MENKVAIKYDANKPEYHHFPPCLEEVAEVFTFGAKKYAAYNYRKGMSHSRYFNAAMRHIWAYWRGEDIDSESGKSHLAHVVCCVLMLLQNKYDKVGQDDRFKV